MVAPNALHRASQSLEPGDIVHLFQLDLSPLGLSEVWNFTSANFNGQRVFYGGLEYAIVEVEAKGYEFSGMGAFPQPTIKVNNAKGFLSGLAIGYQDAIGARLTRIRTYRHFLDGQPDADDTAHYDPDIYFVEQKIEHSKTHITWKLSSAADQQGVMLPKRKMYRDTCTHAYRVPRPNGTFDYTKATCPYAEARFFDRNGVATANPVDDMCGQRLSDCKKRFAAGTASGNILPTRAFPGLVRTTLA